jgi:hypothetical protein
MLEGDKCFRKKPKAQKAVGRPGKGLKLTGSSLERLASQSIHSYSVFCGYTVILSSSCLSQSCAVDIYWGPGLYRAKNPLGSSSQLSSCPNQVLLLVAKGNTTHLSHIRLMCFPHSHTASIRKFCRLPHKSFLHLATSLHLTTTPLQVCPLLPPTCLVGAASQKSSCLHSCHTADHYPHSGQSDPSRASLSCLLLCLASSEASHNSMNKIQISQHGWGFI